MMVGLLLIRCCSSETKNYEPPQTARFHTAVLKLTINIRCSVICSITLELCNTLKHKTEQNLNVKTLLSVVDLQFVPIV